MYVGGAVVFRGLVLRRVLVDDGRGVENKKSGRRVGHAWKARMTWALPQAD